MKPFALYCGMSLVSVAIVAVVAAQFTDAAGRAAVVASACLALGVQVIAFTVARLLQPRHLLLGWGLGSVLRLVSLILYAVVVARVWRAPITPALLSFVAFLFVTTVIEPIFLKR